MTMDNDRILEDLRPRMREARVGHVRRLGAALAVVPLLGFGAVALASPSSEPTVSVAASGDIEDVEPRRQSDLPATDIGGADGGEAEAASTETEEAVADDERPGANNEGFFEIALENYGFAHVEVGDDVVSLVEMAPADGWELVSFETDADGDLVIAITNGDVVKIITIGSGLWDEIAVDVVDFVPPTTTTEKPPPPPEPEPEPEPPVIVDRVVVEVSPAGTFVVERDGETLWGGNVQPNEGFEYDVISGSGWKVQVVFADGQLLYHGKAWIGEDGVIRTETWVEEPAVEPVYQWVETPGGAVKFKFFDGLMYVKEMAPAEGFGSYVYNEVGETVKVDFEGEGQVYIVEAWAVEGVIQWEVSSPA